MLCRVDGPINEAEDICRDQIPLARNYNTGAVAIENLAVLQQLLKLDLGHGHKPLNLIFWAIKVLDTECVNGHDLNATVVAYL